MSKEEIIQELEAMKAGFRLRKKENDIPFVNELEPEEQALHDGLYEAYKYSEKIIDQLLTKIKQQ